MRRFLISFSAAACLVMVSVPAFAAQPTRGCPSPSSGFTLSAVVPGTVGELVDLNADGWVCTRVMPAALSDFNYIDNVAPH
jgi:hypothetical protein